MPGLAGFISRLPSAECERRVAVMTRRLEHEPFHVSGARAFPELGLYAGWVALEGSFAAGQAFENDTRDVALLWAGECFSTSGSASAPTGRELARRYEESGELFAGSLNGLFSGLLADRRRKRALLFNDRYGMERLYWRETADGTYFASEAKALLAVAPETRAFDEQGVRQFLECGCTMEGRTLFRGVELAPGGTLWTVANGQCRRGQYFTPGEWEALPQLDEAEFERRFAETFHRVLPNYFASPGGVGISLTGGLDTRMIMACLPRLPVAPVCYTFAGANPRMRDARVAGEVARAAGLRHELLRIEPDFFGGFGELADRTVLATDGCLGVLGAHEIYFNARARRLSAVRVTGNFGGEVLRSVTTFKPPGLSPDLFEPDFSRASAARCPRPANGEHPARFAAFKEIPWNLFGGLCASRSQVAFRTPYLDNEIVALAFQAPAAARVSGAPAARFVRKSSPAMAAIPTDRGEGGEVSMFRRKLRRGCAEAAFKLDYYCSEGLPLGLAPLDPFYQWCNARLGIQGLHKYLTYRNWLQRELAGVAAERLQAAAAAGLPFLKASAVGRLAAEHASGRRNRTREINAVLTLEAVRRLLFRPDEKPA